MSINSIPALPPLIPIIDLKYAHTMIINPYEISREIPLTDLTTYEEDWRYFQVDLFHFPKIANENIEKISEIFSSIVPPATDQHPFQICFLHSAQSLHLQINKNGDMTQIKKIEEADLILFEDMGNQRQVEIVMKTSQGVFVKEKFENFIYKIIFPDGSPKAFRLMPSFSPQAENGWIPEKYWAWLDNELKEDGFNIQS